MKETLICTLTDVWMASVQSPMNGLMLTGMVSGIVTLSMRTQPSLSHQLLVRSLVVIAAKACPETSMETASTVPLASTSQTTWLTTDLELSHACSAKRALSPV